MSKTPKRGPGIIIICSVILTAVISGLLIVPNLIKSNKFRYGESLYPAYTFEELIHASGDISYCKVISVQPARMTKDINNDVITTDYVMGRLDAEGDITGYFILRTSGGTVGKKTYIVPTEIQERIKVGEYYVLFLSDAIKSSEENIYRVSGKKIDFDVYYHVITPSGIFPINNSKINAFEGKDDRIAETYDPDYNVSYNDLYQAVFNDSSKQTEKP